MGKIIAIAIPKGGVGKTTTALNLALAFARHKRKTLLIDVDPAGSCSSSLGFKNNNIKGDIFDVFNFSKSLNQVIYRSEFPYLDFVPLKNLTIDDEINITKFAANKFLLKNIFKQNIFEYDFILFDCPPYLIGTTTNVLNAADSVLIPIRSAQFSIDAVGRIIRYAEFIRNSSNPKLEIEGILLTMHEYNTRVSFTTKKELFLRFPNFMLRTSIPKNVSVMEATFHHKPVMIFDPYAKSSLAYLKLADEIIERNKAYAV